jgi:hypothetical protein
LTLANVTISSGNVTITNVAVTTANVSGTANVSTMVIIGNESVGGNTTVTGNISANNATLTNSLTLSGGTANGVGYLNGSKVFTTGTAFVFDGTNVGIGTASPAAKLDVIGIGRINEDGAGTKVLQLRSNYASLGPAIQVTTNDPLLFLTNNAERMRIDSSGNLLVGRTTDSITVVGGTLRSGGTASFTATSNEILDLNRLSTDGKLQRFFQDSTEEGYITVSGTTVSYVGGHLARCAQTTTNKDESLVKGTVLSNLDEMNVYTNAEGNPVDNEQLNKVKVSDVEGDANVAGVFVNWDFDEAHGVHEINVAMTGDMIIRIDQGVTVARGDLLMSAGDGTAKPQGDDIIRSKTVAKVTSTHVTCTYADGSYCVPCVLMAC